MEAALIPATATSKVLTGTIVWKAADSEVRTTITTPSHSRVSATGHGAPRVMADNHVFTSSDHALPAMLVPALVGPMLLRELQDKSRSIQVEGYSVLNGNPVTIVMTVATTGDHPAKTRHLWFIDNKSGLPARLEYGVFSEAAFPVMKTGAFDFSQYQALAGVLYPFHIVQSIARTQIAIFTLQSVVTNSPTSSSDFDLSGGAN